MNATTFILRYAGAGVRFSTSLPTLGQVILTDDSHADRFPSELEAWKTARAERMNLDHVTVIPYESESGSQTLSPNLPDASPTKQ